MPFESIASRWIELTQMRDVVDIWQGRCDQDVLLALLRQDDLLLAGHDRCASLVVGCGSVTGAGGCSGCVSEVSRGCW